MLQGRVGIFVTFAVVITVIAPALPANAQSVISAHSGVVHFFEGTVLLDNRLLEPHLGRYPSVPEGAELRTADGRAEVLLTPGVFLRMNDQSAIRMVRNDLTDTQVELLAGSFIAESGEPNPGTSVTLICQSRSVHLLRQGTYRIDSNPPRLWIRQGKAEVFSGDGGQPLAVDAGMSLPLTEVLVPDQSSGEPDDSLRDWTVGRGQSIAADNAITAQIDEDPSSLTAGADNPVYFPVLGVISPGLDTTGLYSSAPLYQPGFSSIYLPGYTYQPLIIGLVGRGVLTYPLRPRIPIGIPIGVSGVGIGIGAPVPRLPIGLPPVSRPPVPLPPVSRPAPVRVPVHVGGRR
jgi:hypothetical protein